MHPAKVDRSRLNKLTDLPNIGPVSAGDLELLGIQSPDELIGRDPVDLYRRLCLLTDTRQDPCVLDVFISVVRFMEGDSAKPWSDGLCAGGGLPGPLLGRDGRGRPGGWGLGRAERGPDPDP